MTVWIASLAFAGPDMVEPSGEVPETTPLDGAPEARPIVGGATAAPGELPAIAALFVRDLYGCSGVLIAPDLVLSAGHCDQGATLERTVVIGALDHTDPTDGERIGIVESWAMPDFLQTYDVAVFSLEHAATTPPAPLLWPCETGALLYDGVEATIAGYGFLDPAASVATTQLHRASVVVEDASCVDLERGCNAAVSPGGELRAGGDGTDTCEGDSGGPLLVEGPEGNVVAGITSRAALPAVTACGQGGLYVRTDALLDWIESTTGRELPRPACAGSPLQIPLQPIERGETYPPDSSPADRGCASGPAAPWTLGWVLALIVVGRGRGQR